MNWQSILRGLVGEIQRPHFLSEWSSFVGSYPSSPIEKVPRTLPRPVAAHGLQVQPKESQEGRRKTSTHSTAFGISPGSFTATAWLPCTLQTIAERNSESPKLTTIVFLQTPRLLSPFNRKPERSIVVPQKNPSAPKDDGKNTIPMNHSSSHPMKQKMRKI